MEFTRKFVLVPSDQLSKHLPTEENLSELDKEMNTILKNRNLTDDEKVKLYMQVLQKKLHIFYHNNGKTNETQRESENNLPTEDYSDDQESIEEMLLQATPKNFKANTRNILNYLKKSKNVIDWTSKGELIYKSKIIKNSNIFDLIKYLQIPSKKRDINGQEEFQQGLIEINFPKSFIRNSSFKEDSKVKQEITSESLPAKKKRIEEDVKTSSSWISLRKTKKKK